RSCGAFPRSGAVYAGGHRHDGHARCWGGARMSRTKGNGALKTKRQQTILSLVSRERLASQEEIRTRLAVLGLDATQSTISRDVEELGLARMHDAGGLRYVVPGGDDHPGPLRLLKHLLDEFALSMTRAANAVVIR